MGKYLYTNENERKKKKKSGTNRSRYNQITSTQNKVTIENRLLEHRVWSFEIKTLCQNERLKFW